jgi:hypothetical protein
MFAILVEDAEETAARYNGVGGGRIRYFTRQPGSQSGGAHGDV